MCSILVIYHSQGGNTRKMAEAVSRGVESIEGVTVNLKRACDADVEDLCGCSGLVVGTPEYFGYMSGMVKDFFDRTYEEGRSRREVFKKPYAVFVSAGNDGRGALAAIERIALGYPLKKIYDPVIARGEVGDDTIEACVELGQTIAAGCQAGIY